MRPFLRGLPRFTADAVTAVPMQAVRVLLIREVDMSNNMPSMTALLGLLALAGYQNREKISEMLKGATASASQPPTGASHPPALGGLLSNLSGMLGGAGAGGFSTEVVGS